MFYRLGVSASTAGSLMETIRNNQLSFQKNLLPAWERSWLLSLLAGLAFIMDLTGFTDTFMHDLLLLPLTADTKQEWKGSGFYRQFLSICLLRILSCLKMTLNSPRVFFFRDLLNLNINWTELAFIGLTRFLLRIWKYKLFSLKIPDIENTML